MSERGETEKPRGPEGPDATTPAPTADPPKPPAPNVFVDSGASASLYSAYILGTIKTLSPHAVAGVLLDRSLLLTRENPFGPLHRSDYDFTGGPSVWDMGGYMPAHEETLWARELKVGYARDLAAHRVLLDPSHAPQLVGLRGTTEAETERDDSSTAWFAASVMLDDLSGELDRAAKLGEALSQFLAGNSDV